MFDVVFKHAWRGGIGFQMKRAVMMKNGCVCNGLTAMLAVSTFNGPVVADPAGSSDAAADHKSRMENRTEADTKEE